VFEWVDGRSLLTPPRQQARVRLRIPPWAATPDAADPLRPLRRLRDQLASVCVSGVESAGLEELLGAVGRPGLHPHRGAIVLFGPLRVPVNGLRHGATRAIRRRPTLRMQSLGVCIALDWRPQAAGQL